MLNVVLVEPEIPSNTGNVGRTCVLTGARLHLVGPLGFSLDERAVKRAGLAYWKSLDVRTYRSWDEFVCNNPLVKAEIVPSAETASGAGSEQRPANPHVHLLTKAGRRTYAQTTYHDGDYLVFGKESTGLSRDLLRANPQLCERIPMRGDDALGNSEQWHHSHEELHPELERDVCGNFIDPRAMEVASLNLSNSVAIVLYEALRQIGFAGM